MVSSGVSILLAHTCSALFFFCAKVNHFLKLVNKRKVCVKINTILIYLPNRTNKWERKNILDVKSHLTLQLWKYKTKPRPLRRGFTKFSCIVSGIN